MIRQEELFTNNEIQLLGQYANVDRIEGVFPEKLDVGEAKIGLIEKDLLTKNGGFKKEIIIYVEMLKRYCNASKYFAVQDYFFAIEDNGTCIVLKSFENMKIYSLFITGYLELISILLQHPIIKRNILDILKNKFPQEEIQEEKEEKESYLLMELIDNQGNVIKNKYIYFKNGICYYINIYGKIIAEVKEENYLSWILECIPEMQEIVQKEIMRMEENYAG